MPVFVEKPLCERFRRRRPARCGRRAALRDGQVALPPRRARAAARPRPRRLARRVGLLTTRVGWGNPHDDVDAAWVLAPHDLSIALEILGELPERAGGGRRASAAATFRAWSALLGERPWHAAGGLGAARRSVGARCSSSASRASRCWRTATATHVLVRRDDADEPERREIVDRAAAAARAASVRGAPPAAGRRRAPAPPRARSSSRRIAELRALAGAAA